MNVIQTLAGRVASANSFFTSGCWVSLAGTEGIMNTGYHFPYRGQAQLWDLMLFHDITLSCLRRFCVCTASIPKGYWGALSGLKLASTHHLKLGLVSFSSEEAESFVSTQETVNVL